MKKQPINTLLVEALESDLYAVSDSFKELMKGKRTILAIDYSLNGTGLAYIHNKKLHTLRISCSKNCSMDKNKVQFECSMDRYRYIKDETFKFLKNRKAPDVIYCEGFSMGSKGRVFDLAEGTGYLLGRLSDHFACPIYKIPPTRMKKIITGKGNARKDLIAECIKVACRFKRDISEDECDALAVMIAVNIEMQSESDKVTMWAVE
jgi:Holliday junction resolvasome RuvABC endonuclease subunit